MMKQCLPTRVRKLVKSQAWRSAGHDRKGKPMLVQVISLTDNEATITDYENNQIRVHIDCEDHDLIKATLDTYEECVFEYDPDMRQFVTSTLQEGELLMNPDDYLDIDQA